MLLLPGVGDASGFLLLSSRDLAFPYIFADVLTRMTFTAEVVVEVMGAENRLLLVTVTFWLPAEKERGRG